MLERTRIIKKDIATSRIMNKINDSDRIIFVNIKKSYEAFLNHDTKHPFYHPSVSVFEACLVAKKIVVPKARYSRAFGATINYVS